MKELLQFISEGGAVQRFHTRPGVRPNTDAEHSFGVALLAALLAGTPSVNLLMACLTHDLGEQYTGDLSSPAKRDIPGLAGELSFLENRQLAKFGLLYEDKLTEEEAKILKLADCFDGLLYCCRELALGNKGVHLIWSRYCEYVEQLLGAEDDSRGWLIFNSIQAIYAEVNSVSGPAFNVFES